MPNLTSDQIKITVKLFAAFQEAVSQSEISLTLPASSPVSTVYKNLVKTYPSLEQWEPVTRYAINLNFVEQNTILQDGDEVALIPPVSGG
jgi:sulfur-carrier protein